MVGLFLGTVYQKHSELFTMMIQVLSFDLSWNQKQPNHDAHPEQVLLTCEQQPVLENM